VYICIYKFYKEAAAGSWLVIINLIKYISVVGKKHSYYIIFSYTWYVCIHKGIWFLYIIKYISTVNENTVNILYVAMRGIYYEFYKEAAAEI